MSTLNLSRESFRTYTCDIFEMKIKPQNSKSNCQQKRLPSRIVLSRVVRTLKIPFIEFEYKKFKVLNVLRKIRSLHIFVQICVDHPLKTRVPQLFSMKQGN
jgi:hypothetical protein